MLQLGAKFAGRGVPNESIGGVAITVDREKPLPVRAELRVVEIPGHQQLTLQRRARLCPPQGDRSKVQDAPVVCQSLSLIDPSSHARSVPAGGWVVAER